jgi:negative regulator of flagellin synthesis FlgM
MIISGKQVQTILQVYGDNKVGKSSKADQASPAQASDEVILSPSAQEFGAYLQQIKEMPEARADKVRELSAQIQAGTYQVDGNKVAEKMIGRTLADNLR